MDHFSFNEDVSSDCSFDNFRSDTTNALDTITIFIVIATKNLFRMLFLHFLILFSWL